MTRWQGDATTILLLVVSCFSACSPSEHELRSNVSAKLDQLDRAARTAATAEEALEAYRRLEELATDADRPFAAIAARIGQGGAFLRIGQLDSAELVLRGAAGSAVAVGHDFNAAVARWACNGFERRNIPTRRSSHLVRGYPCRASRSITLARSVAPRHWRVVEEGNDGRSVVSSSLTNGGPIAVILRLSASRYTLNEPRSTPPSAKTAPPPRRGVLPPGPRRRHPRPDVRPTTWTARRNGCAIS